MQSSCRFSQLVYEKSLCSCHHQCRLNATLVHICFSFLPASFLSCTSRCTPPRSHAHSKLQFCVSCQNRNSSDRVDRRILIGDGAKKPHRNRLETHSVQMPSMFGPVWYCIASTVCTTEDDDAFSTRSCIGGDNVVSNALPTDDVHLDGDVVSVLATCQVSPEQCCWHGCRQIAGLTGSDV